MRHELSTSISVFVSTFIGLFFFSALVFGQKITGTLTGDITDQSGAVIVGAKVSARNQATNLERETVGDERGNYTIPFLTPGTYDILVEQPGFKRAILKGVVIQVNQSVELHMKLEVGELAQEVTVEASAPLLQTSEGSVGSVIAERQIQELPLNGRQFLQLALLVPGVVAYTPGSFASSQRGAFGAIAMNVNGNREGSNLFLIDGSINTDPRYNAFAISPNVDSIEEFKVQTNSYSAEFGQQAGGQINLITRGGTNQFHASAYEFLRNSALDAKNLFDRPDPEKIPPFRQNQFGATFGGALRKDRTFFFGSYEGFRQVKAQTLIANVPDHATRSGDFSNRRNAAGQLTPIYDPATTRENPNFNPTLPASTSNRQYLRDPFPGNIIPSGRIDPIAKGILDYVDLPNAGSLPLSQGRYLNNDSQRVTNDQFSIRIDHRLSSKDQFFGRYSFSDEFITTPGSLSSQAVRRQPRPQILTLGDTHFLNPSSANDFRFGFTRFRLYVVNKNAFTENIPMKLGINGMEGLPPEAWDVPAIRLTLEGFSVFGGLTNPVVQRNNIWQFQDTLSINHRSHNLRMGAQWNHYQLNHATENGVLPLYDYPATPYTADATDPTGINRGSAFADFLLGISHKNTLNSGDPQLYLRREVVAPWFEDTWKINPRLTLTMGIRWDFISPLVDKNDRVAGVFVQGINEPGQPLPLQAGKNVPGYGDVPRGIINTDKNNWAPRIGLAYRVKGSDKTVIRAGYGMFYDTQIGDTTIDFIRNPPFQTRIIATSPDSIYPFLGLKDVVPKGVTIASSYFGQGQTKGGRLDWPTAYAQGWNLSLQREIVSNWAVTAAYVGTTARHLSYSGILNIPYPGPGPLDPRRPFFPFTPIFQYAMPRVNSYYHALQVKSEQSNFHGLNMLASYTFSKSIDTQNEIRAGGGSFSATQAVNNWNLDGESRGLSNFDQRHRLLVSFLYELPFGPGKRFISQGEAVGKILGGWQINSIISLTSGFPFTIYSGVDTANNAIGLDHADSVPGVDPRPQQQKADFWFNPAAFKPAPDCRVQTVFNSLSNPLVCFGSAGRNIFVGPGVANFDFSLLKNIKLGEVGTLQFRTEVFNLFNTPPLGLPSNYLTSSTVGRILSARESRQIQFALRYSF